MDKAKTPPTPLPFRILRAIFPTLEIALPFLARRIVVKLFFTPFRFTPREEETRMQSTGSEFTMNINEQKVIGHSWGEGPIAVLVHGWSGRGMQLRRFINPLLNQGYRVITFDAPGHGASEGKTSTLIQFSDTIRAISEKYGPIELGIGHSLGGAALTYAMKEGLHIPNLVTLSTPTIPENIVQEFLRRINGSNRMLGAIDNYVRKVTGNPFSYYSMVHNLPFIQEVNQLSFHDNNDKEAGIEHAHKMKEIKPEVELVVTNGLGHNRILKDESVIERVQQFSRRKELA